MKQIITALSTLLSAAIIASNTNAAIITTNVTGVLGDWDVKSSKVLIQKFLINNPDIIVQGSISYDDVTEELTALSLYQVGSLINEATVDGNTMSISGLSWGLNGYNIEQLSGSASCGIFSTRCSAMAASITLGDSNSPFEFDGIANGFTIEGVNQGPADAYILTVGAPDADYAINVLADRVDASGNTITDATFQLNIAPVVPVPAAAWLMGSALVGLTAISRRRRS
jgi:hypothetical protein